MKLEFVSYDGKYPNLCSGTLIVKIDGKEVSFEGYSRNDEHSIYPKFWVSGGSVTFDDDWNESVSQDDWQLQVDEKNYPPEIYAVLPMLIDLMNVNVHNGCCGGCV